MRGTRGNKEDDERGRNKGIMTNQIESNRNDEITTNSQLKQAGKQAGRQAGISTPVDGVIVGLVFVYGWMVGREWMDWME